MSGGMTGRVGPGVAAPGALGRVVELGAEGPALVAGIAVPGGGALVEVELMGVCRSDLKEVAGTRGGPGQFGHELVGRVVESDVPGLHAGMRVCLDPNRPVTRGSGFADRLRVRGDAEEVRLALPAVPEGVPARRLVFAEPAACAAHCLGAVRRHLGTEVAGRSVHVLGAGIAGVLIATLAERAGARVALRNRSADRLGFLRERGVLLSAVDGADGAVDLERPDAVVVAASFVVDELLVEALDLVRPGGLVLLYGGTRAGQRLAGLDVDLDAVRRGELRVEAVWRGSPVVVGGSYGTAPEDFATAIGAVADERLGVERLVTREARLAELPDVLRELVSGRQLGKVVVTR
ncbi:alcohol dehydrogenase catalytic domain-containing protein [Actinosynnema pretiosum subsp. pretiosum]|uniref:Alcohol dehydrogenase catalytic domain-containing protein n=1 Tax=Actinosynnema pretiosum subsp. pretiosum TaxID=103721 RepID=A0AA45L9Z7_9PSEU|nr:alcohol dehydrogenase catalytic domain-containing protein [Actinosynnema pretiosum subsp. pretiosum]